MVKRPRPCPFCGEYGTGSPGEGCCGKTSNYSEHRSESSGAFEIILGGAFLFAFLGGAIAINTGLEKILTHDAAAVIGGGAGLATYATGIGALIYIAEKKRRKNEQS